MAEILNKVKLEAFNLCDPTDRAVLADLLAENDRTEEEALCRDTGTRLAVYKERVIPALRLEIAGFVKGVDEPLGIVVDPATRDLAVARRVQSHYLPIAHARADAHKRRALEALRGGWLNNQDHGKIRHWGRAAINLARYCLWPLAGAKLDQASLESATDAVVRFSGWAHTEGNVWVRFRPHARAVVRELWGEIEVW